MLIPETIHNQGFIIVLNHGHGHAESSLTIQSDRCHETVMVNISGIMALPRNRSTNSSTESLFLGRFIRDKENITNHGVLIM